MSNKKTFCRAVRSLLPCRSAEKKRIMQQLESSVDDFLAENPMANIDALKQRFGEPEDVAAAFVENSGTAEILKTIRVRKKIVTVTVVALVIALITYCTALVLSLVDAHKSMHGSGQASVSEVVLPEDFQWDD